MAQTGNFSPIQLYSSSTPGNAPAVGNLVNSTLGSELAINIADGKLFYKDSANAIQVIGWKTTPTTAGGTGLTSYSIGDMVYWASGSVFSKLSIGTSGYFMTSSGSAPQWTDPTTVAVTSISFGTTGLTPSTATKGAITVAGTLVVGNGGTGLTALTAGYIPYGNGTSAFNSSTNLKFDGTTLAIGGTQSAWSGAGSILQLPGPSVWGSSAVAHYSRNLYFDGSNYKYITTDAAEDYYELGGTFVWRNCASGTAGANASFTNLMKLHASGGLSLGNTTDPGATNLSVTGTTNTSSGSQSALNNTATTIYTMPTLAQGLYIVQAALSNNAPATFTAVSLITQGNGTSRATPLATATNMTVSVSGLNIQATQTAGGTATISWSVFRIA